MSYFTWMAQEKELSAAALTVRVQALSPNDNGALFWDAFFPRVNADSTVIREITTIDFRPVSDRREWNERGRHIGLRTPKIDELEMVPIEAYFRLGEQEMQKLIERTLGNQDILRRIVGPQIPTRTEGLALANYRRLEIDTFEAWAKGQITARDPRSGTTSTFSFNFPEAAQRYLTAATAWDDPAENAYNNLTALLEAAIDLVGGYEGVLLTQKLRNAIVADAPQGVNQVELSVAETEKRVQDKFGRPFRFFLQEQQLDVYADGGDAVTRTKVWPRGYIAIVPPGGRVGSSHFAPVARAFEISQATPEAKVDVRGQTAYFETGNGGRELTVECQVNAMPIPEERNILVENTLVV